MLLSIESYSKSFEKKRIQANLQSKLLFISSLRFMRCD